MKNEMFEVTNVELAEFLGKTEGAIRYMRTNKPLKYEEKKRKYIEHLNNPTASSDKLPVVIMMLGFKGGIGKSALSLILKDELAGEKALIINLDKRDMKMYTEGSNIINYAEFLEDEPDISINQLIEISKDLSNVIIIDTPGEISYTDTIDAMKDVDLFILPFGVDQEEIDTVFTTLKETILSDLEINGELIYPRERKLNVMFVLNNYKEDADADYLEEFELEIGKIVEDHEDEFKEINVFINKLKYSAAIRRMKKTKKSVRQLGIENQIAYRIAQERISYFISGVKKAIKRIRG